MPGDNKIMLPQRQLFKELYLNPESDTFGNASASAREAGFSESYAKRITSPDAGLEWVSEIIRDHNRLQKAERVLDECLDMDITNSKIVGEEVYDFKDSGLLRVKQDTAKFVAKGMAKQKYSERQEIAAPNGENLMDPLRDALIALAHDNSTTEDPNTRQLDVQERRRGSTYSHANTVRDLRLDIQKALSESQS